MKNKSLVSMCVLFVASALAISVFGADKPAQTAPALQMLSSFVIDWDKIPVRKTGFGERRKFFDGATATVKRLECHVTTLAPGQAPHPAHRHSDEEVIVIAEGMLEVNLNGKLQRAGKGSVLFFASQDLHGVRNVGEGNATYHVVRWGAYPRAESEAATSK